jgi:hypothetical protein
VVRPGTIRLPLSGGDWIEVKRELNAGEYFDMLVAQSERQPFAKILTYVVAWSMLGLDDQVVPWSPELPDVERRAHLRSLDKATIRELIAVVDRHEGDEEAALDAKKNAPTSDAASRPTFASVG